MRMIPGASGAVQVGMADSWEHIDVPRFTAPQNGYLYVFTSNQSQLAVSTDNLYIYHWKSRMLEEFNYYPYGLTFDVSIANGNTEGNIKYNSQYLEQNNFVDANEKPYGINWYDFMARSYDMQIGRWMQPDPLMQHFSPYLAMSNNPTLFTDPTGLWDGQDDPPRTFPIPITSRTIGLDGLETIGMREATIFANKRTIYPNSLSTNHSGGGDGGGSMDEVRVPDNFGTKYNITYAQSVLDYMKRVDINNANHRAFNQTKNMMERRAISLQPSITIKREENLFYSSQIQISKFISTTKQGNLPIELTFDKNAIFNSIGYKSMFNNYSLDKTGTYSIGKDFLSFGYNTINGNAQIEIALPTGWNTQSGITITVGKSTVDAVIIASSIIFNNRVLIGSKQINYAR